MAIADNDIADVLLAAADAYEEQGVIVRGACRDGKGRRCLVSHIGNIQIGDHQTARAALDALRADLGEPPSAFNDRKGQTVAAICERVRAVALGLLDPETDLT